LPADFCPKRRLPGLLAVGQDENAMTTLIVIPCYNEASKIAETVAPLLAAGYTVVVVDDGSSDGTDAVLRGLAVVRLRHAINLGQGAALETGMEYARRAGADIVVHFDADGQHDWQQIPDVIRPIQEGRADIVFGSRFLRPEDTARVPPSRRILLQMAVHFTGIVSGLHLSDSHNGFRALSRAALLKIRLREPGYAHASEIFSETARQKLRWVEVPVSVRYTDYSRAKGQSAWNALNVLIDLLLRRILR
jgi:polyprenyl-phospho-N-acetylgalactosaminyl synthase